MENKPNCISGVSVNLDRLVHRYDPVNLSPDSPHAFIYYLTISNLSDRTITLLGRKWIVEQTNGEKLVIEGDKIVGETPTLSKGEKFSYNSYHSTNIDSLVYGSFHGIDEFHQKFYVPIPKFNLDLASKTE